MFNWVDFIICAIMIYSVHDAWKNGFITSVVHTAGFVISIVASKIFCVQFARHIGVSDGLGFVILLFGLQAVFYAIAFALNMISRLPVLNEINKLVSLAFGAARGILGISTVFAVIALAAPFVKETGIIPAIRGSYIGSALYNHNVVVYLIDRFI